MKASLAFGAIVTVFSATAIGTELANGLKIETTRPGPVCSRRARNGDKLHVNYRGTLQTDGSEFDSSYGGSPFVFSLGAGQVIKGWDMGLLDMCIGEGRRLTIPPTLGYGSRNMGKIPPNSVLGEHFVCLQCLLSANRFILVFDTELLSIDGIEEDPLPSATQASNTSSPGEDINIAIQGSEKGPQDDGEHSGECKLLGEFAIFVQAALGALALLALVWKRWREHPRRPVKVWFFDVSKQVVGSLMVHFANVFLSMISSGHFEIANQSTNVTAFAKGSGREHPNPCSFYLLNLAIDTTIGIPILVFFLRIFQALAMYTPLANPPESMKSGVYGNPPKVKWWLKQALIYFLGLMAMKVVVFIMFQVFPWLGWVGDWALSWTEGKEWVQITFVMLIFPLIMNAAQYWIIDSFIKDPVGDYDYNAVGQDHDEDEDENEGLIGQRRDSDDEDASQVIIQPQGGTVVAEGEEWTKESARTKERNALPLPAEFEDEDEADIKPSSSVDRE